MDTRFIPHNMHLDSLQLFAEHDPHLRTLNSQKYIHHAPILKEIPQDIPGIYTLCGGRQIGKTTLLKQWMLALLNNGVAPQRIAFFTGELIDDQHALHKTITNQLQLMPENEILYVIIDEVTYISAWDKAIKYLADAGFLRQVILLITGSDTVILQEARMRFPGRRGKADRTNFHLYSLSFREYLQLTHQLPSEEKIKTNSTDIVTPLYEAFQNYLIHGGYLTAINEFAEKNTISISTLDTYAEWIRGDMLKRDRKEHFLREIIAAIIKRYNTQVSWINLAQDLSIDHPKTVSEYINTLESMDAVFVQHALLEDKLVASPKKHKKIIFNDPFIFHALRFWTNPTNNPFDEQIHPFINDSKSSATLIEGVVTSHFKRHYPTYYIKSDGEVDVAYVSKNKFWPIEVKWTQQLRSNDLKQIQKYPNSKIYARVDSVTSIMNIPTIPIPLGLLHL